MATELKERAFEIGRELEERYGYEMVEGTEVEVYWSLGPEAAGQARVRGGRACLQVGLAGNKAEYREYTIRHEWAHIVAERLYEGAAHGPEWREIAEAFGAEDYLEWWAHCERGDYECVRKDTRFPP